ncbi:AAA family ATPase [Leekyejoonella antrihumi]|uniref:AAA family ATPase n=1 Tax=Leekyejoonella antrihumi TaxID=1660198 RepID=A0A563DTG2_9MICO|nr:AAA family ATPase [Leekyejoonella antrihumi]TWP33540.1 hypothetical protein FGL98_21065 [Leekyejoonella antrihumi]
MPVENEERRPGGAASMVSSVVAGDSGKFIAGTSWCPVELGDIVAGLQSGTLSTPRPTVGRLADGSNWLYAGRTNGLAGESGCGKTWTALQAVASELQDGNAAMVIDLEDNEIGVVGRLLSMGVKPWDIVDPKRFAYIHPDESFKHGASVVEDSLDRLKPTLVVLDSTGESMALEGCDPNSDDAVARWFQRIATRIARRGPAVLLLDHLPKAKTTAPSPIGSQRKRAALSGVQFIQEVKTGMAFAKGRAGEAVLTCTKDRSGHFVTGQVAAKLIVNPNESMADGSGCDVLMTPADDSAWAPTKYMAEISVFMEKTQSTQSTTVICQAVSGKKATLIQALSVLVDSGYLSLSSGPSGAKLYDLVRPYKNGNPITVPANHDAHDSGPGSHCTEHEWHAGQTCNPGWCHFGHHGRCNKLSVV